MIYFTMKGFYDEYAHTMQNFMLPNARRSTGRMDGHEPTRVNYVDKRRINLPS